MPKSPPPVEDSLDEHASNKAKSRPATLTPEAFYDFTAKLTGADWAHSLIYVYRLWPAIERKPSNIDKVSRPIDESYILQHHGSGKYRLRFNDTDRGVTLHNAYPEYDDPDHPPLYDIRELKVTHESNRTLVERLKREGKLSSDGDIVVSTEGESETSTLVKGLLELARDRRGGESTEDVSKAIPKIYEMFSKASEQSLQIALGQVKAQDPASFIALLATAKELFAQPAKNGGDDPLIQMLMEDRKAMRDELREMRSAMTSRPEADKPRSLVEELRGLGELKKELKDLFGGGSGDEDWKLTGVKVLGEQLGGLVELGKLAMSRSAPAAATPPAAAQPAATQTQTPPANQEQTVQTTADPLEPLRKFLLQYQDIILNAFQSGVTGDDFAQSIVNFKGVADYQRIANCGQVALLQVLLTTKGVAEHFAGLEPQVEQWVADFIEFGKPEPAPPAEDPKPKGGKKKEPA